MSDDILLKDQFEQADQATSAQLDTQSLVPETSPTLTDTGGTFIQETLAPAHPHAERMTGVQDLGDMSGRWTHEGVNPPTTQQTYSEAGHFADTSPVHPEFNPLLEQHQGTLANGERIDIAPLHIRKVHSFYESGQSKEDADAEMSWVLHHMTAGTGGQIHPILSYMAMGRLDSEHTHHARYEDNFAEWMDTPIDNLGGATPNTVIEQMVAGGQNETALKQFFRKAHLDDYRNKWQYDPEWKLGEKDYFEGMEWMTRDKRRIARAHMKEHGTESPDHQRIPELDMDYSVPRAKYSRAQRESGYHKHFTRAPMNLGEPIRSPIIPTPSNKDSRTFFYNRLIGSLGSSFYKGLVDHHVYHTDIETRRRDEYKTAQKPKHGYDFLKIGQDGEIKLKPLTRRQVEGDKNGQLDARAISRKELLLAAGVRPKQNEAGYEFYPAGEHPFYSGWEPKSSLVTWTPQDIENFLNAVDEERSSFKAQNDIRNALQFHVNHSVRNEGKGGHPEAYTGGRPRTLATHWTLHGMGGHGKTYRTAEDMRHAAFATPDGRTHHTQGPQPIDTPEVAGEGERGVLTEIPELTPAQEAAKNLAISGRGGAVVHTGGLAAAFAPPEVNASRVDGQYIARDPTDLASAMNPAGVNRGPRFAGNRHAARNKSSWSGSYHDEQFQEAHDLASEGLFEEYGAHLQQHLTERDNALVTTSNPYYHLGNADVDFLESRHHHAAPTYLGMAAPPGNPQSGIHHGSAVPDDAHHTTGDAAEFARVMRRPSEENQLLRRREDISPLREGEQTLPAAVEIDEQIEASQKQLVFLREQLARVPTTNMTDEQKENAMNIISANIQEQEESLDDLRRQRDLVMINEDISPSRTASPLSDAPHRRLAMQKEEELDHITNDYFDVREELDALLEEQERNSDTSAHHQEKIDEKAQALKELYAEMRALEKDLDQHYEEVKLGEEPRNREHDTMHEILTNHNSVIEQAAQQVMRAAYEQGFDPIAEMGPATAVAWAMRHGNTFVNKAPHNVHKLEAKHPSFDEVETKTGRKGLLLAQIGLNVQHLAPQLHGKPLSLENEAEDWLEALGMQAAEYDLEGNKTAGKTNIARDEAVAKLRAVHKKLRERFSSDKAFHVMPVAQFLQNVGGIEELNLRGFGDLHSHVKDDLSYYIDENGDAQPKFAPMNRSAMPHQIMLDKKFRGRPDRVPANHPNFARHQRRVRINDVLNQLKNVMLGDKGQTADNALLLADGDFIAEKPRPKKGTKVGDKHNAKAHRKLDILDSFIIMPEGHEPRVKETHTKREKALKLKPVGRAGGHDGDGVMSLYDSPAYRMNWGHIHDVSLGCHIDEDGNMQIYRRDEPQKESLVTPTLENAHALVPEHRAYFGDHRSEVANEERPRSMRESLIGRRHNEQVSAQRNKMDGPSLLASLTNPDFIRKDMPEGVPSLQAMHRIFELDDLEHLKGFTGDWIVSDFPEGPRFFVTKKDGDIESKADLSDEEEAAFKKVSDKDFVVDVIRGKDVIHIFEILEFDGNDTYDMPIQERIKVLRGALESVEMVHTPSASDTKLTDDAGLEAAVKNLEGPRILMRDAKSAYMKGEPRHPKWVMLQPGSEIVLMVLDRRGEGPYQYRLGTGPIAHGEDLGDRRVKHEGDDYMDVGASFQSKDKYDVGDLVRVDVTNVTETEASEKQKVYTVHAPKIEGEAEGEGLVSSESLSMLAKGELYQHPVEVFRKGRYVQIKIGDSAVVYKATVRGDEWSVHTPEADNPHVLRLSENQRPFWSPVVGVLLKGQLEIEEKAEVKESTEPAKPLTKPRKVEGTDWKRKKRNIFNKSLLLLERLLEKSSVGAVGDYHSGAKGLGFDYATPIQSPSGPTNLDDAKTMPDYDVRDIERDEKEEAEDKKKFPKNGTRRSNLELTDEKAVIHTD